MAVVEGGALGWPAWLWPLLAVAAAAMVARVPFAAAFFVTSPFRISLVLPQPG
ncbi:MAG TPA: hypothetical protein VH478_13390 [Trebonia sp.]|jgi:hypothetical protein|nr:hypothetical protein [Trebonia sp.]